MQGRLGLRGRTVEGHHAFREKDFWNTLQERQIGALIRKGISILHQFMKNYKVIEIMVKDMYTYWFRMKANKLA